LNSLVRSAVDRFRGEATDILVSNAGVAFDKKRGNGGDGGHEGTGIFGPRVLLLMIE
jgi:hypothetical protein